MQTKRPSDKRFGYFMVLVLTGTALYGLYKNWDVISVCGLLAAALAFSLIASFAPKQLAPLNLAWFRLGQLMGKIVNPLVMGIIFFGLITPTALLFRLFGRDELKLKSRRILSYWRLRRPPGPAANSFKNQF